MGVAERLQRLAGTARGALNGALRRFTAHPIPERKQRATTWRLMGASIPA
jgi:hypothetical protein